MNEKNENQTNELLAFFKALSDANRLKIVGLLANQPHTVEQIAAALNLGASTVSHHLSRLAEAGLVSARAEGYYSVYSLHTEQLESMSQRLLKRDNLVQLAEDVDMEAYERKVLRDFMTPDGKMKSFPAQQKKLLVILRHIHKAIDDEKRYTEKEFNEFLKQYNEDYASLRRYLIVFELMQRENGIYWKL